MKGSCTLVASMLSASSIPITSEDFNHPKSIEDMYKAVMPTFYSKVQIPGIKEGCGQARIRVLRNKELFGRKDDIRDPSW